MKAEMSCGSIRSISCSLPQASTAILGVISWYGVETNLTSLYFSVGNVFVIDCACEFRSLHSRSLQRKTTTM